MRRALPLLLLFTSFAGCLAAPEPTPLDEEPEVAPDLHVWFDCPDPDRPCPAPAGLPDAFQPYMLERGRGDPPLLVATGYDSATTLPTIYSSPDGGTWTEHPLPMTPEQVGLTSWSMHALQDPTGRLHATWKVDVVPPLVGGDVEVPEESIERILYVTAPDASSAWTEPLVLHEGNRLWMPRVAWTPAALAVTWSEPDGSGWAVLGDDWSVHHDDTPCTQATFVQVGDDAWRACTHRPAFSTGRTNIDHVRLAPDEPPVVERRRDRGCGQASLAATTEGAFWVDACGDRLTWGPLSTERGEPLARQNLSLEELGLWEEASAHVLVAATVDDHGVLHAVVQARNSTRILPFLCCETVSRTFHVTVTPEGDTTHWPVGSQGFGYAAGAGDASYFLLVGDPEVAYRVHTGPALG